MAYQHLLPNLITTLTQLVLTRRDAYLKHVNNALDSCRKKKLRTNSVLGQDMFDQKKLQEMEKHLIELGFKSGNKRFHPYSKPPPKKRSRGRGKSQGSSQPATQQAYSYPMQPQYMVPQPFFPPPQAGNFRGSGNHRGGRRGRGKASATVSKPPPQ